MFWLQSKMGVGGGNWLLCVTTRQYNHTDFICGNTRFGFHLAAIQPSSSAYVNKRNKAFSPGQLQVGVGFTWCGCPLPLEPLGSPCAVARTSAAKWVRWGVVTVFSVFQAKRLWVR